MNNQMQQFGDGGLNDEGGTIDEVSGNEVPVGGTKQGVRDDIPANVSEGEFIFPEDVTRFIGLDKLMAMRQDAKMGLKKMEAMGQMGNSDEATMPDDMPFGMADLMVVSGEGKPMELAVGGFVPVENYTEVQDMISDKADKSSVPKTDADMKPQNFVHGGVAHGGNELETSAVPTFDPDKVVDYDAYMNQSLITAEEYRNSDGDSMIITFINGSPLTPILPGYTLYIKPEEDAEETDASIVTETVNQDKNNTSGKGRDINANQKPTGVDYAGMSDEDFIERMEYENTKGYKILRAVALGVTAMVPFGGALGYSAIRGAAISNEARLKQLRDSASGATKTTLNTLLDEFYKSNGMQDSTNSNEFQQWVDGVLVKLGFAPDQTKKAAAQAVAIDTEGGSSEFDKKIQEILKTETGRGSATGPQTFDKDDAAARANAASGITTGVPDPELYSLLNTNTTAEQTASAFPQAGEFAGMAGAGPDPYSGDVVKKPYTTDISNQNQSRGGRGPIAVTNKNAVRGARNIEDLRKDGSYMGAVPSLTPDTPYGGGVEVQDMVTGDSTITPKQPKQGEFESIPEARVNEPSRTPPVPPLENYKSPDFSGGISNKKNEDGTVNAASFIKRGFNQYVRGLPPENYTAQDAGYENEFTSMGPSIPQQDVLAQTQEVFPQTGGFSTAEAQREESRLGIDPPPPSVLAPPISQNIQTQTTKPVSNATTSVEGGRGAMPQYDGRALSGDLGDPRNASGKVGSGTGYDIPQQNTTTTPGASDKFKAAIKPTTVKKKVAPKKEEPQAPNIEQFQFNNFKANVITTPSTRTGKTFFGGNEKINPEGTPGKDSVGAFREGIYAGDGFEWTTGGPRVYTGVNLNVTGSSDPMVATQPPTKDLFEYVNDLFGSGTSSSKPSGSSASTSTDAVAKPVVKTGDGGVTAAKKIVATQKNKDGPTRAEKKAARASTPTAKASTGTSSKAEATTKTDKAVEKFGRATGGRAKGGLINKPKAKAKTTNKRGLAARK